MGGGRQKRGEGRHQPAPVEEGRLRYIAADSIVLFAKTPRASYKLCRILFGKDESIYVPFPYLDSKRGILSTTTDDPGQAGPTTCDLQANGSVVDYDIKYAHHKSGVAHFSKSGKGEDRLPRRKAFPLDSSGGIVFVLQVYWLGGVAQLSPSNRSDFCVGFKFQKQPFGIELKAEWAQKTAVLESSDPKQSHVGPHADIVNANGIAEKRVLLGQPLGMPLQDHLLVVSARPVPVPSGADKPMMVFFGAIDRPQATPPGALAFMFPYSGPPSPAST